MKQFYFKSLLIALFVLFGGGGISAQETKTLKYEVSSTSAVSLASGTLPDGVTVSYSSTYDNTYQLTSENSMTLTLSNFPFPVSSVTLNLRTNKSSGQGNLTVTHNDVQIHRTANLTPNSVPYGTTFSEYTFNAEDTQTSGDLVITLAATTNSVYCNAFTISYLDNSSATGTKEPDNSFAVEEDNATIGVPYTMPEFTTSSDGTKTYSSSDTDVATINGSGEITLKKAGDTEITVTTTQTATYASRSASYILHVAKGTPVLNFAQETVTAYMETDQNGPTLTNSGNGTPTYTVDPDIATIQSNGYIHPKATGTATVTVTTSATEAWNEATASYTLIVKEAFSVDAKGTYELVTDASTLNDGDQILITYITSTQGYVLGEQSNNNFNIAQLNSSGISADRKTFTVTNEDNVTAAVLEGSTGAWYFHTNNGYLYAASSSKNYLRTNTLDAAGNNAKATISISNDGDATITFKGSNTHNLLKYNSGNTLFSCYESGQKSVQIYKKVNEKDVDMKISSVGYATLYYSDRALKVPTGVTAKTYKVTEGKLAESKTYAAGNVIPKGEAVVLKGAAGDYTFLVSSTTESRDADSKLKGSDGEEETAGGNYYYALQAKKKDGTGGPGFYWMNSTGAAFTNGAHKAYLALDGKFTDSQSMAKSYYLFDEATTDINSVVSESIERGDAYNLNGQRVGSGYKGVVIVNGKKIMVK